MSGIWSSLYRDTRINNLAFLMACVSSISESEFLLSLQMLASSADSSAGFPSYSPNFTGIFWRQHEDPCKTCQSVRNQQFRSQSIRHPGFRIKTIPKRKSAFTLSLSSAISSAISSDHPQIHSEHQGIVHSS